jgi:hypothetical protein
MSLRSSVAVRLDGLASFASDTKVLLASGRAVPISSLKPGDKVLATNTQTGKTSPETTHYPQFCG